MRLVDADDDVAADFAVSLINLVAESGGWLHPQARVVIREGAMSISCDAADGEPLVAVPRAVMVRIGRVEWAIDEGALRVAGVTHDFGDVESETLFTLVGLLNACGKIPALLASHPAVSSDLSDAVVERVRAFRPGFRTEPVDPAALLWSTRCFRLPVTSASPEPVALPIIDLLDHHPSGARATWHDAVLSVPVRHATATTECLLDYGLERDAIGMAVVYGFADAASTIAHSAPLTVEVPGVGAVHVEARGRSRVGERLSVHAEPTAEGTVLSHLTFEAGQAPGAQIVRATGWGPAAADAAADAIAQANLELASQLIAAAAVDPSGAAAVVRGAARAFTRAVESSLAGGWTAVLSSAVPDVGREERISEDDLDRVQRFH